MAVVTFTRRQVVDMIPEFLSKRAVGYRPKGEAMAKALTISWTALVVAGGSFIDQDDGIVHRSWYRRRAPYAIKDARPGTWAEVIRAGLAQDAADGWRLTPKGTEAAAEHQRRMLRYLAGLALPEKALAGAAAAAADLADRVPATERAARARRTREIHPDLRSTARTLSDALQVLWAFRDDCHVGAWQEAGYEGPVFDVLSYVWQGPGDVSWTKLPAATSLEALVKALEAKQDRADVEHNVAALARRGDLDRSGDVLRLTEEGKRSRDAIEEETDRRYFAIWDLDDTATARLGEDLRAVIDALPTGAPPTRGTGTATRL